MSTFQQEQEREMKQEDEGGYLNNSIIWNPDHVFDVGQTIYLEVQNSDGYYSLKAITPETYPTLYPRLETTLYHRKQEMERERELERKQREEEKSLSGRIVWSPDYTFGIGQIIYLEVQDRNGDYTLKGITPGSYPILYPRLERTLYHWKQEYNHDSKDVAYIPFVQPPSEYNNLYLREREVEEIEEQAQALNDLMTRDYNNDTQLTPFETNMMKQLRGRVFRASQSADNTDYNQEHINYISDNDDSYQHENDYEEQHGSMSDVD